MKRLVASLVLAAQIVGFLPTPSRAAYPTQDLPSQVGYQQSRVPKNRRVMVVIPARWAAFLTPQTELGAVFNGVYQVIDALRNQGCDVHIYSSRVFESYQYGTKLWREAGDHYGLALVVQPGGPGAAGDQRYWNADSTNVQIVCAGGVRSGGALVWNADSTTRGMVDASIGRLETQGSVQFAAVIPWTATGLGRDTLWADNQAAGVRCNDARMSATHTGITGVFRVLHPIVAGNPGPMWGSLNPGSPDTASMRMPGASWATRNVPGTPDSLVNAGEIIGPVWKVRYAVGRDVWFFKFTGGNVAPSNNALLLYACMARFLDVPPIKWALDWDDVTNINDSNNYPRWRASAADSSVAMLQRYGVLVGSNGVDPGNLPGYVRGFTPDKEDADPPGAAVTWTGPGHSYLKQLVWTHHAHDSATVGVSSNLVGGYGGYAPSNGPVPFGNGHTGRRFASRRNPGANDANFVGAGGNFGIVQRLEYADSVARALGMQYKHPPYLTFPANQMLPINWKTRGSVAGYTPINLFQSTEASCPIDSVLWGFDYFLNGRLDCGLGRVWLRSGTVTNFRNEALWADRDSFVAGMIAQYPRDRWTTRVGNRLIQAEIVHSFNQGIGTRAQYINTVNARAGYVTGLSNKAWKAEMHQQAWVAWTSYDSDANKQMNMGANGIVDFPHRQSTRIVYLHPGQQTAPIPGFTGSLNNEAPDLHVEIFLRGIHSYMRACDAVALKPVQKSVHPWLIYN